MAKYIQFFRNNNESIFTDKDAAKAALTSRNINPDYVKDGSPIVARYYEGNEIKSLFGIGHVSGNSVTITIFDNADSASADVEALRQEMYDTFGTGVTSGNTATAQLEALSGNNQSTSAETSVEGAKRYADEKVNALDYTGVTIGDGVVIVNVTETDGVVTATSENVGNLKLTNYSKGTDSGDVAATDSINEALSKLEKHIEVVSANTDSIVEGLDGTITAETGYYINKVDEVDGKISGTTVALPTVAAITEAGKPIVAVAEDKGTVSASAGTIEAQYVDVADADGNLTATNVEAALAEIYSGYVAGDAAIVDNASESANTLAKLEELINGLDADAATYTIRKDTEDLPATIKERYTLVETKNGQSTDKQVSIDVPKDSHIVTINYITDSGDTHYQNLEYVYITDSGTTSTTYVDMSQLVLETEFASGVTSTNGIAHGVVDPNSESFLTVGAGGFKVSGISGLVTNAIEDLDAVESGSSTHVSVQVDEADGLITAVIVTENNIASADALSELSGKTVTTVAMTGGTATTAATADGTVQVNIDTDGSKINLTDYSKGSDSGAVASTDSVNVAIGKLENQIDAAKAAADAAATIVASGSNSATTAHMEIASEEDPGTGAMTYTIDLKDVASETALNGLSAKTVTEIASSNSSIGVSTAATTADDGTVKYDIITDGSKIKLTDYNNTVTGDVAATDSVNDAIAKLENKIGDSSSALTNEIAHRKAVDGIDGDVYSANTGSRYISGASNLNDADVKLAAALATVDDDMLTSISGGSAITVTNKADKNQSIELKLDADDTTHSVVNAQYESATHNALQITSDGLFLDSTWDCGEYTTNS